MKLPFPHFLANTDVTVSMEEHGEEGVETRVLYDGPCILDDKARTVRTAEQQLIRLTGRVVIAGDIAPGEEIRGVVTLQGSPDRTIAGVSRPRNPDGSVFSTELDLS